MSDSNPPIGEVRFRIEAWPHDPGANGEEYSAGCLPASDVALELRRLAERVESDWATPECPWPDDHQPEVMPSGIAAAEARGYQKAIEALRAEADERGALAEYHWAADFLESTGDVASFPPRGGDA